MTARAAARVRGGKLMLQKPSPAPRSRQQRCHLAPLRPPGLFRELRQNKAYQATTLSLQPKTEEPECSFQTSLFPCFLVDGRLPGSLPSPKNSLLEVTNLRLLLSVKACLKGQASHSLKVTIPKAFQTSYDWAESVRKPASAVRVILPDDLSVRSYGWHKTE